MTTMSLIILHGIDMNKILIVDDNEVNRDILRRRLERSDYKVLLARDGQESLDMLAVDKPDLILMDINLPDMDGWEVIRFIKSCAEYVYIPVIILTAHTRDECEKTALNAGCDDFEVKPVNFPILQKKIEFQLNRSIFNP